MSGTYTVYINYIDITEFISSVNTNAQTRTDYGQIIINNAPTLTGINTQGFWDQKVQSSPFYNYINLSDFPVEIWLDDLRVFKGFLQKITSNNTTKLAAIELRSKIQDLMESGCIYLSDEGLKETPADVVREICILYNINFDFPSFQRANVIYEADNVYIKSTLLSPEMTILDVFSQIAQIGIASISVYDDILYFNTYESRTSDGQYTFTDSITEDDYSLIVTPSMEAIPKEVIHGYSIDTLAGKVSFGLDSQQGKSIQAGIDASIQIQSLQAGIWIGEKWLEYLQRLQYSITFGTSIGVGKALVVGMPVNVVYTTGNWNEFTSDIVIINNSFNTHTMVTVVTR